MVGTLVVYRRNHSVDDLDTTHHGLQRTEACQNPMMSILVWVAALVITAGAAAVQGTVGIGLGMISVPILALLDPELVPAPQLLIAFPITMAMAWRERRAIELTGVGWIIGARVPGAFLGAFLLGIASERVLNAFIAVIVLLAVVVMGTGISLARTTSTKVLAGAASGVTGVVASIGGPPIALIYSRDEADTIRSTLSTIFFFGLITSAVFRWSSGHLSLTDVKIAAVLLPAALIGLWVSFRIKDRVPKQAVRFGILIVCGGAAMMLLVKAIVG